MSELNKNNIAERLAQAGHVPETLIEELMQLIETCEFARYAPESNEHAAMDSVYERVCSIIEHIDSTKTLKR